MDVIIYSCPNLSYSPLGKRSYCNGVTTRHGRLHGSMKPFIDFLYQFHWQIWLPYICLNFYTLNKTKTHIPSRIKMSGNWRQWIIIVIVMPFRVISHRYALKGSIYKLLTSCRTFRISSGLSVSCQHVDCVSSLSNSDIAPSKAISPSPRNLEGPRVNRFNQSDKLSSVGM